MKKILITTLLFITIISNISYCFAFEEIGIKKITNLDDYESVLIYQGNAQRAAYMVYEMDGIYYPAYCLNHGLKGAEDKSYTVDGSSKLQDIKAWRTIINGFPYKSPEELGVVNEQEAYTATKQAVFTILYDRNTDDYSPVDSDAGRRTYQAYLNIVEASRNSNEIIMDDLQVSILPSSEKWEVDNLTKNCASKIYNLTSNVNSGNYKIELEGTIPDGTIITDLNSKPRENFNIGEQFKILIPIENLLQDDSFTIKVTSNLETKPVVYGSTTVANTQNYALTGLMYEEKDAIYAEEYFENTSKIVIVKKEYGTDKKLQGVKFNLLDANKNVVKENLVTDQNGEIILEKMMPGIYYLQEIETLENYNLDTNLINIELGLNEEVRITVDNSLKIANEVKKLPVTGY